eukprot:scaffold18694_cov53-Cyclotella_meneghiniana.AAC.4
MGDVPLPTICSTLEDTIAFFGAVTEDQPPKIKDEFYVPHFDGKAAAKQCLPKGQDHTLLYFLLPGELFGTLAMVKDGTMCNNMGDVPLPTMRRTLARACMAFSWAAWMANILASLSMSRATA